MVEVGQLRRFRHDAGPRWEGLCLITGQCSHPWVTGEPREVFSFLSGGGRVQWLWESQLEAKTVLIDEEVADADANR